MDEEVVSTDDHSSIFNLELLDPEAGEVLGIRSSFTLRHNFNCAERKGKRFANWAIQHWELYFVKLKKVWIAST